MATDPDTLTDPNPDEPNPGDQNPDDPNADEGNGDDSPYAPLAKDMGWLPKNEWTGAEADWKPAEDFIRAGRDIQRDTSRELKSVRSQLDTIAKTSATLFEQQVNERVDQLTAKYTKAVEDGDPAAAFKIGREIDAAISSTTTTGQKAPSPDAQAFAERNASWFNKPGNEYATARAVEICNMLNSQGYTDHAQQLRIAEQRLKQELPHLFGKGMNGKPAPGVNPPGSRSAGPSGRAKGYADLPPEARKVADDMSDRDVFKLGDVQKSKDLYARNYFANLEGKA